MRNTIISLLVLSLIFALFVGFKNFALSQEDENENEDKIVEVKNIEKFMKKHMERIMGEMEKIGKEMDRAVRGWGKQSFFTLTPGNQAMAGGTLENVTSTGFTLNTNGFKTNWIITTDTKVVGSNKQELNLANLQANTPVRVKGKWDGQNLVAEVVIVFKAPSIQPQLEQIQNLLQQIINVLRERGFDVTPMLQKLQQTTSTD